MTRGLLLAGGLVLTAAMTGLPGAPTARAGDREMRSITVDAAGLDLARPAGIDELARRIHRAVNRICGADRDCRDEA